MHRASDTFVWICLDSMKPGNISHMRICSVGCEGIISPILLESDCRDKKCLRSSQQDKLRNLHLRKPGGDAESNTPRLNITCQVNQVQPVLIPRLETIPWIVGNVGFSPDCNGDADPCVNPQDRQSGKLAHPTTTCPFIEFRKYQFHVRDFGTGLG